MRLTNNSGILKSIVFPIHRAGRPFIVLFAVCTAALGWVWGPLGFAGVILTVWCIFFFRDPDRVTPQGEGLVVSPADGIVQMIVNSDPPEELGMESGAHIRIAVFMNVFDVHVNRAPIDGRIKRLTYTPGKFLNASLDKASEDNERQALLIETSAGVEIGCVQIAGLVARRILCDVIKEQELKTGERFGMIRFGSRVDIYVPKGTTIFAIEGQRVVAGETVLASLDGKGMVRQGEVR
ncbi:MAG: phosphatidylserine decarboxylase family protein [Rhodospirillaceae bacterium]|nr:phosphatidylserine decarboxylase family protein [Rhodospirillaceae bacterium]